MNWATKMKHNRPVALFSLVFQVVLQTLQTLTQSAPKFLVSMGKVPLFSAVLLFLDSPPPPPPPPKKKKNQPKNNPKQKTLAPHHTQNKCSGKRFGKNSPWNESSGIFLSLSEWPFTICLMPNNSFSKCDLIVYFQCLKHIERREHCHNENAKRLFTIMEAKKTNLAFSADLTNCQTLLDVSVGF